MRKEFAVLLVLFLSLSGSLFGQEEKTGYEIGVYGAMQNWKSRSFQIGPPQSATPIPLTYSYKDRAAYGVRGNFLSKGHWAGELSYSYQKNNVSLTRQSFAPVTLGGAIHQFFYNEMFYPKRYAKRYVPFITGGFGMAAYHLGDDARAQAANPAVLGLGTLKNTDTRVALNYGTGIKGIVAHNIGIRADFRHIFSDVPSYGLPKESSNPAQIVLPIQGKLQTYEFSAGIYFRVLSEGFK